MWAKNIWGKRKGLFVLLIILMGVSGCTGIADQPKGWSGGIAANGTLFFGSMEGELVALNESGGRMWGFLMESSESSGGFGCAPASSTVAIYGTPAVAGDLVYIGGYNGVVYAINTNSGALRWVYPRDSSLGPIVGGPVVTSDSVYIGSSDGKLYALDAVSGDLKWTFKTSDKIWSTPALDGGTLYIGSFDKKVYAINTDDGSKKWEAGVTEGVVLTTPVIHNGTVYFGSFDRQMYALDAVNGGLKWKSELGATSWFWAKAVVLGDRIYAPNLDGKVYILNTGNGSQVTEIDLESPISSAPVLVDNSIIITTEEGKVFSLNTGNNQQRELADIMEKTDEELTVFSPLFVEDRVVYIHVQTKKHGSRLYALNTQSGAEIWHYPPLSGN